MRSEMSSLDANFATIARKKSDVSYVGVRYRVNKHPPCKIISNRREISMLIALISCIQ